MGSPKRKLIILKTLYIGVDLTGSREHAHKEIDRLFDKISEATKEYKDYDVEISYISFDDGEIELNIYESEKMVKERISREVEKKEEKEFKKYLELKEKYELKESYERSAAKGGVQ